MYKITVAGSVFAMDFLYICIRIVLYEYLIDGAISMVSITTPALYQYMDITDYGFDASKQRWLTFEIFSCDCHHVALMNKRDDTSIMYELDIGCWEDTQSVIRKGKQLIPVSEIHSGSVHPKCDHEEKSFWVGWEGGVIQVGHGSVYGKDEFMTFVDLSPHVVNYFAITTSTRADTWKFDVRGPIGFFTLSLTDNVTPWRQIYLPKVKSALQCAIRILTFCHGNSFQFHEGNCICMIRMSLGHILNSANIWLAE